MTDAEFCTDSFRKSKCMFPGDFWGRQKLGIFSFQSQFWQTEISLIFPKMIFYYNIDLGEQLLLLANFVEFQMK